MNRKLNATLMAISASGLFMLLALMVASPLPQGRPAVADAASDFAADEAMPDRRGKAARRGLAMPYFSFAHGARRIGG